MTDLTAVWVEFRFWGGRQNVLDLTNCPMVCWVQGRSYWKCDKSLWGENKAGWTKPAPPPTSIGWETNSKGSDPSIPPHPLPQKKYTAEKFLSNFCISNSVNIQPIWNAWDIGQMITHSLKAAWKQRKTLCCRRFNGKIKSKEEKDEEEHNINKLKETLGEKNQMEFGRRK